MYKSLKLTAIASCLTASLIAAASANSGLTAEQIARMGVGDHVNLDHQVCGFQAGDDDSSQYSTIVIPSGFEVANPSAYATSANEGHIKLTSVTQPGYIDLSRSVGASVISQLTSIADSIQDKSVSNRMRAALATMHFASIVDASTHAELHFHCFAEGHRYKGDGHIYGNLRYTLIRRPVSTDYQKILLELARIEGPITNQLVTRLVDLIAKVTSATEDS